MGASVDLSDPLAGHVRVELRRADTRMSEQLLNDPQVGAALEQVRRERVAQRVRADAVAEPGRRRRALTIAHACCRASRRPRSPRNSGPPRSGATWPIASERRAGPRSASAVSQSSATSPTGTSRSRSPLPMTRTNAPSSETSSTVEAERLADPQAGRVQQLEERAGRGASGGRPRGAAPTSATVSVSGRSRGWRGRSRCCRDVDARSGPRRTRSGRSRGCRRAAAEEVGARPGSCGRPRRVRAAR